MKTFKLLTEDRKELKTRIEALTGEHSTYTGMPRSAYEFESYTIEKDGTLVATDSADDAVLETLLEEGLIEKVETEKPSTATIQGVEEVKEIDTDELIDNADNILKPEISFPTAQHTGISLRNLINMLYSKGKLITNATGGEFAATEELVEELKYDENIFSAKTVIETIQRCEGSLTGVEITEDKVTFTGFPEEGDPERLKAFIQLAAMMNKASIKMSRILPIHKDEENEKYAMRNWMVRIGLDGEEYKTTRKYLIENLSGHSAFKTPADQARWKAKQDKKREALKAAKKEKEEAEQAKGAAE